MKKLIVVLFILVALAQCLLAQSGNEAFQQQQDALQSKDSLAAWVDNRVNYATALLPERLPLLMQTAEQAWRKPQTVKEKEAWLWLLINQGYYQLQNGDILTSISQYERAYDFYRQGKFNLDVEEYIFKPLSNNYTRLGDYERAVYIQNRSLNLALKQNNTALAASAYCNLSTSYRSKNDLLNAEKSALAGLAIAKPENDIYGLLQSNMADIKNQLGEFDAATVYVSTAIQRLKTGNQNPLTRYWLLSAYTLAGDIAYNKKNYSKAQQYYQQSKSIFKLLEGSRKRELTYLQVQLGRVKLKQNQYAEALSYFNQAIALLIPKFKPNNLYSLPSEGLLYAENKLQAALEGKAEVLQLLDREEQSLQSAILAFAVAEELRTEFTYAASKQQLQTEIKALAESVIEKSYRLWLKTKKPRYANHILIFSEKTKSRMLYDALNTSENLGESKSNNKLMKEKIALQRSLTYYQKQQQEQFDATRNTKIADLKFQLSSLQKQLNIKNPSISSDISETLSKIPKGNKAIIFFSGIKNTYLIEANDKGVTAIQLIEKTEILSKKINGYLDTYFYRGPEAMANNPKQFYKDAFGIFKLLFANTKLEHKKLLFVKDGVLNFLPFESLITDSIYTRSISSWPYLLRKADISYALSVNSTKNNATSSSGGPSKFAGIFLSKTGSDKNEIPAVEFEYNQLKEMLSGSFVKNEEANASNFTDALTGANILHISSHSYLSDRTNEPVLELYKSKYYLLELGNLVKVPELVVLSACQTSDGKYISGEGVESFSRGFIAAGAQGVISSLWSINDESAANLMLIYYQNLLDHKHTNGMLRKTKLDWLNKNHQNKMVLLPYYWDSLIYTGVDMPVNLEREKHSLILWTGLTLLLILTSWLFVSRRRKTKHFPNP